MGCELEISRYKLSCREWIEDKVMVYNTGNCIQYTVQTITENNTKKNVDWNTKVGSEKICGKNRQVWWSTEGSRTKANRVLPRDYTGHRKHPLPAIKEMTLHVDITRWSIPKSD